MITKNKNLYEIAISKGITTNEDLYKFIGNKRVKVISRASGHDFPERFVIDKTKLGILVSNPTAKFAPGTNLSKIPKDYKGSGCYCTLNELTLETELKSDLIDKLKDLTDTFKKEEQQIKEKLDILEEYKLEEYDEDIVNIIKTLNIESINNDTNINKLDLATQIKQALS